MASLKQHPQSPYWSAVLLLEDGSQTTRSTKIPAKRGTRAKALSLAEKWQRIEDSKRASRTTANKQLVGEQLIRAMQKLERGEFCEATARETLNAMLEAIGLKPLESATVEEFFRRWVDSKATTKSARTAQRYRQVIGEFLAFIGTRARDGLATLTADDFERFRDRQLKLGKGPSTANLALKILRAPMNAARRRGLVASNPAEAIDLLPAEGGVRSTFSREQIRALLAAADAEWRGMILFGACHGLRIGDAARLAWANIDAERGTLRFHPQKTSRGARRLPEEYPLHPDVVDYLEGLPAGDSPKAPIFPTLSKLKVGFRFGLSDRFRRLMRGVGIIAEGEGAEKKKGKGRRFFELGFHSLRHTAISEMANRGVSKEVRMKLSGHKSNVHERYTHHELETLRRAVEAVPSFVSTRNAEDSKHGGLAE